MGSQDQLGITEEVTEEEGELAAVSASPLDPTSGLATGTAPLATVAPITLPAAPAVSSAVFPRMNPQVAAAAMKVTFTECEAAMDSVAEEAAPAALVGNLGTGFAPGLLYAV